MSLWLSILFLLWKTGKPSWIAFYNNIVFQEEEHQYEWDPETESVAEVVPLFEGDRFKDRTWIEVWLNHTVEFWWELEEVFFDENMDEIGIVPLFAGSDWPWYDDEEEVLSLAPTFTSLFKYNQNSPWYTIEEEEPTNIVPLFGGVWNIEGSVQKAPSGVESLHKFWHGSMAPCDEDGDEDYGADLFESL